MLQKMSERILLSSLKYIQQKEYWTNKLSDDMEQASIIFDERKNKSPKKEKKKMEILISDSLYELLWKLSKESAISVYIILLAVLKTLIYSYSGKEDITVVSPIYKPNISENTINDFLFIRDQVRGEMTFKELLIEMRQTVLDAYENQDYPFDKILDYLCQSNKKPAAGFTPDILFLLRDIHDEKIIGEMQERLVFSFIIVREEEKVKGDIFYDPGTCEKYQVEQVARHYIEMLGNCLQDINSKISAVTFLPGNEKKQLIFEFNRTQDEYPAGKTIHDLLEEQVEKNPDHAVVRFEDRQITYGELNKRSIRLAVLLREKGIKPGAVVGIMVDRSEEMIVAIAAVLKAGGAYLPIDIETPRERMASIMADCNVSILLTNTNTIKKFSFTFLQGLHSTGLKPYLTRARAQVTKLDDLPIPDRSLVNYEKYNNYIGVAPVKNRITLQATRGCPFHCSYCHKIWPKTHMVRSAENIFEEVQLYYKFGIKRFVFIDDIFNFNIENSARFFRLIIENGMTVQIFFPNGLRGDILTGDYIDLMVEAGLVNVALALETASPRLQKLIRKNLNIQRLRENIEYLCQKHPGIILELQTMHGLPTETGEEALMTLNFIKSIKWIHFPYINILKVYPNTRMANLAIESGMSREEIITSDDLAHHELQESLPFEKNFTLKYQTDFLNNYFLLKKRLLHVLPYQMKVLTRDEIVQKYNSYLNMDINRFEDILNLAGIEEDELGDCQFLDEDYMTVPGLNQGFKKHFPPKNPRNKALKILLLDLSQFFSRDSEMIYDVVEPPLGLMYLMTYLNREFGDKINGKIAKSRIDFDNFVSLRSLLDEFKPDVIGIRTLIFHKNFFHLTSAIIRQWGIDVPIIAGGPYATSSYDTILQDRNIDLVVLGEGEVTFSRLIEKFIDNGGKIPGKDVLREIPGIAYIPGKSALEAAFAREFILLDELRERYPDEFVKHHRFETVNRPGDLAYVIFTSGSTGKPKGIMIEHGNVVNLVHGLNERIYKRYENKLNIGLVSPFMFDASVKQIFGALMLGHCLCIVPENTRIDAYELLEYYNRHNIEVSDGTPAHIRMLVEVMKETSRRPGVKHFIIGGEILSRRDVKDFLDFFGSNFPVIVNAYGPTECCVDTTTYDVVAENIEWRSHIPIGKPMPNFQVYILGTGNNLKPVGVPGELCVSGMGVGRGYINSQELTKEKFTGNPFIHWKKMYRTGDIARWLPGGNIEFVGRVDHQVKIRGFRIELGEIESTLLSHRAVKETLVLAIEDERRAQYLCAYFVPCAGQGTGTFEEAVIPGSPGNQVEVSQLRSFLSKHLPDYMIPSYFIPIPGIPLSRNGKLDRKALPEPVLTTGGDYTPPGNKVEKKLAEIWASVLGLGKNTPGIDDNFFELGGNSLYATILVAKIHKELKVKISLVEIFNTSTIRGLAKYIEETAEYALFTPIEPVEKKKFYVLSSAQKRLYFLQQMVLESTAYNMPQVLILEEDLDKTRLDEALKKLIARHESFRTSFVVIEDEPVQKIQNKVEFVLGYHELRSLATGTGSRELKEIIDNFEAPFDLSKAPLLRVGLVKDKSPSSILILDMHHIITDGISQDILTREFISLYAGEELTPLKLQYKDYSMWKTGQEQLELMKQQEAYWLNLFSDELPVLNLLTDFQRPAVQGFEGSTVNFRLNENETKSLKIFARQTDATLYISILSVLSVLLSKLSRQEDIIVGTPIAGRRHPDLEHLVGMFVNTLAVRSCPGGDKTYIEFLTEVKERTLEAFDNQDYQFEDLVDNMSIRRDTSRNPIFDVMFVFQDRNISKAKTPALKLVPYWHESKISKFDLTLSALEVEGKLELTFEYSTNLFKKETIEKFGRYLKKVVNSIRENPEKRLSRVEIISKEEKKQVLFTFNYTGAGYPGDKTIDQLFEDQVSKTPDGIAVSGSGVQSPGIGAPTMEMETGANRLTYRELSEKANQVAHYLAQLGVEGKSLVAIMIDRSLEMIFGILGILKAGCGYVPLNPKAPAARVKYIMDECNIHMLVTGSHLIGLPGLFDGDQDGYSGSYLCLDEHDSYSSVPHMERGETHFRDLAYVIFTSGSTGKPKGVPITYANLSPLLHWGYKHLGIGPHDRTIQNLAYYFDWSVWEIFITLTTGASLYMIPDEMVLNPGVCFDFITSNEITVLHATPTQFQYLDRLGKRFETLKYLFIGAEKLTYDVVESSFASVNNDCRVFNMYGPTEAAIIAAVLEIDRQNHERFKGLSSVPIGKPVGSNQLLILDKYLKTCPVSTAGELYIAGEALARGYLNDPEKSGNSFVKNVYQYEGIKGNRLYRTGDLARWLPDGNTEFLGRIDTQIKIRGLRIELGEIESHLLKHADINEAVVLAKDDGMGDRYLCAYVVPDRKISASQLREFLSHDLPGYMVPSYFVSLEEIPLTPNGKLDRKALPEPEAPGTGPAHVAPGDEVEEKMAEIWGEVLGIEKKLIGIDSDFFELGGHSLKAVILLAKIHRQFNVKVPMTEIFAAPTIRKISGYIKKAKKEVYAPIEAVEEKEYYALSSAQKRLFILADMEEISTTYNMPLVIIIKSGFSRQRLEQAFQSLINRHQGLRTSFDYKNREPAQIIHKTVDFKIKYPEAEAKSPPDEIEFGDMVRAFIKPFNLTRAPLLRVSLVNLAGEKHALLFDMHHIISDGMSMSNLTADFVDLYEGKKLPPLKIQYKDFSQWQNKLFQSREIKKQEEFWLKRFRGEIPVLNMPLDHPRSPVRKFDGAVIKFMVGKELTEKLNKLLEKTNTTLYMVLLAVYNVLLSKYTGQEDIVVGFGVSGRNYGDLQNIIGFFVNTLVMRNQPKGNKSFQEFLEKVKSNALEVYENQDYPFERLINKLGVSKDPGRNPLFDAAFELQNFDMKASKTSSLEITPYEPEHKNSRFDLYLMAVEIGETINMVLEYSTSLFKPSTAEKLTIRYISILEQVLENTDIKLERISISHDFAAAKSKILQEDRSDFAF